MITDNKAEESTQAGALVRMSDQPPTVLPTIVLHDLVPFPGPVVSIILDSPQRREVVLQAKNNSGFFMLINRRSLVQKQQEEDMQHMPDSTMVAEAISAIAKEIADAQGLSKQDFADMSAQVTFDAQTDVTPVIHLNELNAVGIVARLVKVVRLPDDRLSAFVHLMRRVQPVELRQQEPYMVLRVMYPIEIISDEEAFQSTFRQVRLNMQAFFKAHPTVSDDLKTVAMAIEVPGMLADFVAQHLSRDFDERLVFLNQLDLAKRMHHALEVAIRELDLLTIGNRISQEIRQKVERHQRDFLLREQLKAIRTELGEERDAATLAVVELREKLDAAGLSPAAKARADDELQRLQLISSESPEHNVIRSYIEWIASLPWSARSNDAHDIVKARAVLDDDHYGLDEVKERIIEFLAVHQLNPNKVGTLICFAGPPGVGKTSLGQSIARALNREFYRFSVGGMRDEAEIKGHRRTYIGAMPGRILQGLRQVKTNNPVFMLDELDKIGSDWRGDPSSALLEVLDPAQNKTFMDHYLDLPFDLSRVMFIATVNVYSDIPSALRDRLEIIELSGYIPAEKLQIAKRFLLPRERQEHGLKIKQLQISPSALTNMITSYTREAGVRELNRLIAKVCRKRAVAIINGSDTKARIGHQDLVAFLGKPKILQDHMKRRLGVGVVMGLAWTASGGDVLFIEAASMPGKGLCRVTGHLEQVMKESAELALDYVKSHASFLKIDPKIFATIDIHLHFPAGAVKKDGPSAGIAITTAIVSLLRGKTIPPRLAMTGEITLVGDVLAVGGIREKVVAAQRARVLTVILPESNLADVEEIPLTVREGMKFIYAADYKTVAQAVFA